VAICYDACMFFFGYVPKVQKHFILLKQNVFNVGYELRLEVQFSIYNLNICTYSHTLYRCHSSRIDAFQMKLVIATVFLVPTYITFQANVWRIMKAEIHVNLYE
jgi:hypothetical protein